jgi:hypothetical protein
MSRSANPLISLDSGLMRHPDAFLRHLTHRRGAGAPENAANDAYGGHRNLLDDAGVLV